MKLKIWQRKNGLYEAKVSVKQKGTTQYHSVYGHSKAEVKRKAEQWLAKERLQNSPTFHMIAEQWDNDHQKEIEYYTYDCYKAPLKELEQQFGNIPINEITPLQIQSLLNQKARQNYAHQTIKLRLTTMNLICEYAILHQYLVINPCNAVKVPKTKPSQKVLPPSQDDIQTMLNSVDEPFGLFPYMLYYTGCRRSELLGLRYEDIEGEFIRIKRVVIFENGHPVVRNYTKSQAGMRKIPLLQPVKDHLPKRKKGYIFTNKKQQLMTLSEFNIAWSQYKRKTGVSFSPHQLRHSYATLCYDAQLSPKDAQTILGHSKESVTMDIYTSISKEREEGIFETLNNFVQQN